MSIHSQHTDPEEFTYFSAINTIEGDLVDADFLTQPAHGAEYIAVPSSPSFENFQSIDFEPAEACFEDDDALAQSSPEAFTSDDGSELSHEARARASCENVGGLQVESPTLEGLLEAVNVQTGPPPQHSEEDTQP